MVVWILIANINWALNYVLGTVQSTLYDYLIWRVRAIVNLYFTGEGTEEQRAKNLHLVSSTKIRLWTEVVWLEDFTLIHYWGNRNSGKRMY